MQFWSEMILVISNQTRGAHSFDFEITRMIPDQIALHSVQLPLLKATMQKILLDLADFALQEQPKNNLTVSIISRAWYNGYY